MSDDRKPEPWEVTKEDIDRERQRIKDNESKYPALRLLIDKLPDDYDPQAQPETTDQARAKRRIRELLKGRELNDFLIVTDAPTDIFVQYLIDETGLVLDAPNIDPNSPKFGAWLDAVHDAGHRLYDNEPFGYQVFLEDDVEAAFSLGLAALKTQGALARELDVDDGRG